MGSDLFEIQLDSSADAPGHLPDNDILFFKFAPVPCNSGAQLVASTIMKFLNLARRLRPPLRQHVLDMAKEDKCGYAAIGAEGGFNSKELNTNRGAYNQMSVNTGPPVTALDEYVNGPMKNNPTSKKDDFGF